MYSDYELVYIVFIFLYKNKYMYIDICTKSQFCTMYQRCRKVSDMPAKLIKFARV